MSAVRHTNSLFASSANRAILLAIACLFLVTSAHGQELNHNAPESALNEGVIHVKVDEAAKPQVVLSQVDGVAQMGVASIDQLNAAYGAQRIERIFRTDPRHAARHASWGLDRWYRVYFREGTDIRSAVRSYHGDANVELSELSLRKERTASLVETADRAQALGERIVAPPEPQNDEFVPDDPLYGDQWHFNNTGQTGGTPGADISLPAAHAVQTGSSDVIVQVIDSGIELDHPDIRDNLWINPCEEEDGADTCGNGYVDDIFGYNFADDTSNPEIVNPASEGNSHGLHVSGTIAATNNNGEGVASVAGGDGTPGSGVRIMTGLTFGSSVSGFAEALVYGADNGAVISNNSWGYTTPGVFEQAVLDAIDYFTAEAGGPDAPMSGGLVVVAAGNSNSSADWYPGFHPPAMAVSATDHNDGKSSFSNFGDWIEIAGPSGEAFSHPVISTTHTSLGTGYGGDIWAGTSMAAPHVAGVAALIASEFPGQTAQQVRTRLIGTADATNATQPIGPRVNAFRALTADDTPPAAITDLVILDQANTIPGAVVDLQWTATGDAGSEGTAASYDLRFSTDGPIETEDDFAAATPVQNLPTPQEAGTVETFSAEGLPFDAEVHFSIKAIDVLGNASDLSNSPSATTGPGPVIGVTPDNVEAVVDRGTTEERTLTVSNDGEGVLEYSVFAAVDGGDVAPRMVAAPSDSRPAVSPIARAEVARFNEGASLGTASPSPFLASDFVYQLDKGTSENAIGLTGGGDIMWMNAFQVLDGAETITSIASAWGVGGGEDVPAGRAAEFLIYDDPTNNGDPSDAVLLARVDTETQLPHTDEFTVEAITPTSVSGVFFIAALYEGGAEDFPAPLDEADPQGASWIVGNVTPNTFDAEDLTANEIPPANLIDVGFPGNWLLRADGTDNIVAFSPNEGLVGSGESEDVTVTINAEEIPPGQYEGVIRFVNNDPENSPLDVPYDITVDGGPPQIVVAPRLLEYEPRLVGASSSLSFTVLNEGGEPLVVENITSDSEDFTPLSTSVDSLGFGESATVAVAFSPTTTGVRVGTIAIESNAANRSSIEVAVVGEGLPAPEIAADPESFDVTVPIGSTVEDTLRISNVGAGDLDFQVEIGTGTSVFSPSEVAFSFNGERSASAGESVQAERPIGSHAGDNVAFPAPTQASDFVYQLDDGSTENAVGAGGGDIAWLNAFRVVDGITEITEIASAFGSVGAAEDLPEGVTVEFLLYDDPTNNGDPNDAVLLQRIETTSQNPNTDQFQVVSFDPITVEGSFFVGVVYRDYEDGQFPAPLDESSPSQGASWVVAGGNVNVDDLSDNETGPGVIDSFGIPGNWLLRADGVAGQVTPLPPEAVTVTPSDGDVAPGEEQELIITFSGENVPAGEYGGNIRILSNDPLNSPFEIPVSLLVDAGPPSITLTPDPLAFDDVVLGSARTLTFEVGNEGEGNNDEDDENGTESANPLFVEAITSDSADFEVLTTSIPFVVRDGETVEVTVQFAPTAVGSRTGSLTIESNDPDSPATLALEGEALETPQLELSPEVVSSTQQSNEQVDVPLTLSNNGMPGSTLEYSFPAFAAQELLNRPGVQRNNTSSIAPNRNFEKGQEDPHAGEGHPVLLGAGGPDAFGHLWIDSNEPGGPAFQWFDITELGDEIQLSDDFGPAPSVEVELPFEFVFYGELKESVRVDNNGFLFFDGPVGNYFINQEIPNPAPPNGIVAPYWDDLDPSAGGTVHTYHDSENDRFIVQYTDVPDFFGVGTYTFQIFLQRNGTIRFQYLDMGAFALAGFGTVGIESPDGTDGVQIAFNTEYIENNLAVEIAPPVEFITSIEPASGVISAGEDETVQVTFDSEGLGPDVYEDELGLSTNAPRAPFGLVPAVLSVVGENGPTIANAPADQQFTLGGSAPFEIDVADVFDNPLADEEELTVEVEVADARVVEATLSETNLLTVTPLSAGASTVSITAANSDGEARATFLATVGQLAVNVERDFGGQAADATNYRLVALPGVISLPMNDVVAGEAGLDWQAFRDEGDGSLVQFDGSETFNFEAGRGFWLTGQQAWQYAGEHAAVELDRPDRRVAIPLEEGWNIISNPMSVDLDLVDDIEGLNGTDLQPFWAYNGAFGEPDSTFASALGGEAYYFLNDAGLDELVLQPAEDLPVPPAATAAQGPATDPLLRIAAHLSGQPDVFSAVRMGVTEASAVASPLVGPPSSLEVVSLRINTDDASLMREQRMLMGDGETFDLNLRTQLDEAVTLQVSGLDALNGQAAALLHPEAGTTYDLSLEQTVTIEPTGDITTLQVAIGTQAYVDGEVAQVLPVEVTMLAYPNPVQDQATVRYTLKEAEDVRLEVYDILGRRVATLAEGQQEAGVHEVQFNANGLASGVYFGRLRVGGQTLTQKITVVR